MVEAWVAVEIANPCYDGVYGPATSKLGWRDSVEIEELVFSLCMN